MTSVRTAIAQVSPGEASGGALILLYHRIAEVRPDPQQLCVSPTHFAEHLEILNRLANPIGLGKCVEGLERGTLVPRAVVVTFDDGYADNVEEAVPLLTSGGVPATLFVAGGCLDGGDEFWWDELEGILLSSGILPQCLSLSLDGQGYESSLGTDAAYDSDASERARDWSVLDGDNPTRRHQLYRELFDRLRVLPCDRRHDVLAELREWSKHGVEARPTHRTVTREQVAELADDALIEIGAHTVSHPVLSRLTSREQQAEIEGGKARLEEAHGRRITSFSYPYGTRSDYRDRTVALVRQAGFDQACSNFAGLAGPQTDRFQLPRMIIRDWDGDEFQERLGEAWCATRCPT